MQMHKFTWTTSLLATSLLAQGTPEAAEPNNTTATATTFTIGDQLSGEIDNTGTDEDWFRISLAAASDYKIWTGAGFTNPIGDTRIRIYAADGTTILLDVDDGNTSTHGYYTTMLGTLAAGDYYVAVRGFDASTFGTYTLDVVIAAPGTYVAVTPPLANVAEAAEENDPRLVGGAATPSGVFTLNAGNLAVGGSATSFTSATADYDFYEIQVSGPGAWVFETIVGASAPASTDTVVHLADSTLTRLAFDDDGGAGSLSRLAYSFTTPGTYYVAVSGYFASNTGNYLLQIVGPTPALPVGVASVTEHTGGCAGSAGTPVLGTRSAGAFPAHPELPVLGSSFWLDGTNLVPNTALVRIFGLLESTPPLNLAVFGFPLCNIEVSPIGLPFSLSDANGNNFWEQRLPVGLGLIGLPIEFQLVMLDQTPSLGIAVSNHVSAVCGITH